MINIIEYKKTGKYIREQKKYVLLHIEKVILILTSLSFRELTGMGIE